MYHSVTCSIICSLKMDIRNHQLCTFNMGSFGFLGRDPKSQKTLQTTNLSETLKQHPKSVITYLKSIIDNPAKDRTHISRIVYIYIYVFFPISPGFPTCQSVAGVLIEPSIWLRHFNSTLIVRNQLHGWKNLPFCSIQACLITVMVL